MYISISSYMCPQNHRCPLINTCPAGAISQNGNNLPVIDHEKCTDCGKCIKYCGMRAVSKK